MSIKSVVLIGASGNLGPAVLSAIKETFQVTVLARQSSKSTFPSDVKVVKISDDFPRQELVEAFKGHDAVVSLINKNQDVLIDAAIEAGIQHFIPSEFGSDNQSEEALRAVPLWQEKADTRDYLRRKESSKFSWTAIANNPFFDWALTVTKGGFFKIDIANKKALVLGDGNLPWSATNLHQVGAAVSKVLQNPEKTRNQFILVESFTVTQNKILAGLEKELGFRFERETVDAKKWFDEQVEKSSTGDIPAAYSAIIGWTILDGSFKGKKGFANELLGLTEENFDESIKKAAEALKG